MKLNGYAAAAVFVGAFGLQAAARADSTFQDNGDSSQSPYFRTVVSQAFELDPPNDGFGLVNGAYVTSNNGPYNTVLNGQVATKNGATSTVDLSSISKGFLSSGNSVGIHVDNAQSGDGYYAVAGQGTMTTVEFFSPEAVVDSAVLHWHVSGSTSSNAGVANSRLDVMASTDPNTKFDDLFNGNQQTDFGPGDYSYAIPGQLENPIKLLFWSSAYAEVDRGQAYDGQTLDLSASFANTYSLYDIDVFDPDGNPITDWTLQDTANGQTVFNQDGPVASPEPAALSVLAAAGLLGLRRRRPA